MAEENDDNTIAPGNMELESGDISDNCGTPGKEASDDTIDREKTESDIGYEEDSDRSAEDMTEPVEQEDGDMRENSDIVLDVIGKTSPPEETAFADDHVGKSPTAIIVGANHKFTVRSRYLSASIGSCHDLCKYGHKHEPEKKTMRPVLGTIREARTLRRTSIDDPSKSVLKEETKKKALLRRLSLPGPVAVKDTPTRVEETSRSTKDVNQSKLKRFQSEIKASSVSSPGRLSSRSKTDTRASKKTEVQSLEVPETSNQRVKEIKAMKGAGSHKKGEEGKAKEPMGKSISPNATLKRSPSMKARLYKNLKGLSRSKNQNNSKEDKTNGSSDVPEKTLYMIEPSTDKKPAKKAPKIDLSYGSSPNTSKGSRFSKTNSSKGNQNSRVGPSSSSPHAPMFRASKAKERSQPSPEVQWGLDSNTEQSGTRAQNGGAKTSTTRAKSTVDRKLKAKGTGISHPEERDNSAWKVKFRRGTVVALQFANNSPKKLRFKKGRILGNDQNAKDEADGSMKNREDTGNEPHDTSKPEPGKVHLRHQEASGKKDNVDLNDVIEETASKLVKTRKSKVKALVGAFETVMSFRDRKTLVETSAS